MKEIKDLSTPEYPVHVSRRKFVRISSALALSALLLSGCGELSAVTTTQSTTANKTEPVKTTPVPETPPLKNTFGIIRREIENGGVEVLLDPRPEYIRQDINPDGKSLYPKDPKITEYACGAATAMMIVGFMYEGFSLEELQENIYGENTLSKKFRNFKKPSTITCGTGAFGLTYSHFNPSGKPVDSCENGSSMEQVNTLLKQLGLNTTFTYSISKGYNDVPNPLSILSQLKNMEVTGKPSILGGYIKIKGVYFGHAVLVHGYRTNKKGEITEILVNDPFYNANDPSDNSYAKGRGIWYSVTDGTFKPVSVIAFPKPAK